VGSVRFTKRSRQVLFVYTFYPTTRPTFARYQWNHFSGTSFQLDGTDNRDSVLGIIVIKSCFGVRYPGEDTTHNYGVRSRRPVTRRFEPLFVGLPTRLPRLSGHPLDSHCRVVVGLPGGDVYLFSREQAIALGPMDFEIARLNFIDHGPTDIGTDT
jgi:hypothetical protein